MITTCSLAQMVIHLLSGKEVIHIEVVERGVTVIWWLGSESQGDSARDMEANASEAVEG